MLKLTKKQIYTAGDLADRVICFKKAKDNLISWTVPFSVEGLYRGWVIDVPVPTEGVRKELDERIAKGLADLASLGIELLPGGDGEGI